MNEKDEEEDGRGTGRRGVEREKRGGGSKGKKIIRIRGKRIKGGRRER